MYGYLGMPCTCRSEAARAEYRSYYCGLCNVLARSFGPGARWLINRDSVALALVWGAQTAHVPLPSLATCCNPWGARRPLVQTGAGMAFAAAVTVAGVAARAADHRADERGPRRWAWAGVQWTVHPLLRRGRQTLDALGFDVRPVAASLVAQTEVERAIAAGQTNWRLAAEPTAAIFARLMAQQAALAGNQRAQLHFAELGRHVGRVVYWLDACEDWAHDRLRERFNPLPTPNAAQEVLPVELEAAAASLAAAPLARYRSLLADVLIAGPRRRAAQLLAEEETEAHPALSSAPRQPSRRRSGGSAPGPCEQGCSACGDCCTCGDSCCQGMSCCSDCCEKHDSNGCGCDGCGCDGCGNDGCCDCSCDCPCDSGGSS